MVQILVETPEVAHGEPDKPNCCAGSLGRCRNVEHSLPMTKLKCQENYRPRQRGRQVYRGCVVGAGSASRCRMSLGRTRI